MAIPRTTVVWEDFNPLAVGTTEPKAYDFKTWGEYFDPAVKANLQKQGYTDFTLMGQRITPDNVLALNAENPAVKSLTTPATSATTAATPTAAQNATLPVLPSTAQTPAVQMSAPEMSALDVGQVQTPTTQTITGAASPTGGTGAQSFTLPGVSGAPTFTAPTAGQLGADQAAYYENALGGYAGMPVIESQLRGQLAPDVLAQIYQAGAERGIATGGAGSPNANAAMMRALGITSQQLQQKGLENLNAAYGNFEKLNPLGISAQQLQAWSTVTQQLGETDRQKLSQAFQEKLQANDQAFRLKLDQIQGDRQMTMQEKEIAAKEALAKLEFENQKTLQAAQIASNERIAAMRGSTGGGGGGSVNVARPTAQDSGDAYANAVNDYLRTLRAGQGGSTYSGATTQELWNAGAASNASTAAANAAASSAANQTLGGIFDYAGAGMSARDMEDWVNSIQNATFNADTLAGYMQNRDTQIDPYSSPGFQGTSLNSFDYYDYLSSGWTPDELDMMFGMGEGAAQDQGGGVSTWNPILETYVPDDGTPYGTVNPWTDTSYTYYGGDTSPIDYGSNQYEGTDYVFEDWGDDWFDEGW